MGGKRMGTVDLTGVTPPLFVATLIYLLAIFSMLSMMALRLFQKRYRGAVMFVLVAAVLAVGYVLVLKFGLGY